MKPIHLGVAALAAALAAGCGGGSDNSDPETFTVPGGNRLTAGAVYTVEGKTLAVPVTGGTITLTCPTDDGCTVMVSRDNGRTVAMSAVEGVSASFEATPSPPPPRSPTTPPTGVSEEEVERREDTAREEGRMAGEATGLAKAEARQRAPKWADALNANDDFGATGTRFEAVTVAHMRDGRQEIGPTSNYPISRSAPSISGFSGTGSARDVTTHEDTIYLYTNIGSPNTRPFWKVHGARADGLSASEGSVTHSSNPIQIEGESATLFTENGRPVSDSNLAIGVRVDATYGGTDGWLVCTSCDAVVPFTSRKFPNAGAVNDWEFRPRSVTAPHQRPQDETYLYFGIWAHEPKAPDGTPEIKWIAGGGHQGPDNPSASISSGNFSALKGTAKFAGGAVGQYAIDRTDRSGSAKADIFTATVSLTADFGASGSTDGNTLSGTVSGFREKDGSSLNGWTLSLGSRDSATAPMGDAILGAAGVTATTGGISVAGTIDGVTVGGDWAARLYGVDNVTAAAPDNAACQAANGCSADVAGFTGWFRAADSDGDVVAIGGAFGAAKQ